MVRKGEMDAETQIFRGLLRMMSWHPGSIDNAWTSNASFYNITEAIMTCLGSMLLVCMVVRFKSLAIKPIYISENLVKWNSIRAPGLVTSRRTTSVKST